MRWCVIMLMGSLLPLTAVLAGKSDIIAKIIKSSWIPIEDYATLLEVAFHESECCNVQICGRSMTTENLFNEFVRIYPFEYILSKGNPSCNGYLVISTSVDRLLTDLKTIPTTISTTSILFILDGDVEASSRLFNISLYGNANVDIVARNCLWTLSVNYLHPRIFRRLPVSENRYFRKRHMQGIVNFRGRELQVATVFNPPFCYLRTTVNQTVKGIEAEFYTERNEVELDGVELKIFMLIATRLNFKWTLRKPSDDYRYGRKNGTSWHGGMIGQIFRKEVDIAFSSIRIKWDYAEFVNLSTWASLQHIHFAVPRPKPYPRFWALTRPLSPEVWAVILAMLIVQSVYVYTRAWISPRIPSRFRSFVETWTEMSGRLVGVYTPGNMQGLKLLFNLWHIIGVLLVTAYSCSLAARLTNPTYNKRIDTPEDFFAANLSWGKGGVDPIFTDYFDYSYPWAEKFKAQYKHEESDQERHERILTGNYAIIGRIVGRIFFPENAVFWKDLTGFRIMKEEMGQFYSAFAVQPWLLKSVNRVLGLLVQAGLVDYHLGDVIHRRASSALRDLKVERDVYETRAKVLDLTPLGAGFGFLCVGLVFSTVIFYHELRSVAGGRTIREVLVDIKKKRQKWRAKEVERKNTNITKTKIVRVLTEN